MNRVNRTSRVASFSKAQRKKQAAAEIRATIEDLLNSKPAVSALMVQPIPVGESFRLAEMLEFINGKLKIYWDTQNALGEKYSEGKIIPATEIMPDQFDIPKGKQAAYEKETLELRSMEIEVPGTRISVQSIPKAEISASQMMQLKKWLITS